MDACPYNQNHGVAVALVRLMNRNKGESWTGRAVKMYSQCHINFKTKISPVGGSEESVHRARGGVLLKKRQRR